MIKSRINHFQFNIDQKNIPFYRDLLGWTVWADELELLGIGNGEGASLWFACPAKPCENDYDGPGMNHLGLRVAAQSDVDAMVM